MHIYVQDHGWAGCIVVIADSEEEARTMMVGEPNYEAKHGLQVLDICKGLVIANLGDM